MVIFNKSAGNWNKFTFAKHQNDETHVTSCQQIRSAQAERVHEQHIFRTSYASESYANLRLEV